ncbi:MAG: hypothetical protein GY711_13480 [bacterium]|nr:hypothetical protein [bacterium]
MQLDNQLPSFLKSLLLTLARLLVRAGRAAEGPGLLRRYIADTIEANDAAGLESVSLACKRNSEGSDYRTNHRQALKRYERSATPSIPVDEVLPAFLDILQTAATREADRLGCAATEAWFLAIDVHAVVVRLGTPLQVDVADRVLLVLEREGYVCVDCPRDGSFGDVRVALTDKGNREALVADSGQLEALSSAVITNADRFQRVAYELVDGVEQSHLDAMPSGDIEICVGDSSFFNAASYVTLSRENAARLKAKVLDIALFLQQNGATERRGDKRDMVDVYFNGLGKIGPTGWMSAAADLRATHESGPRLLEMGSSLAVLALLAPLVWNVPATAPGQQDHLGPKPCAPLQDHLGPKPAAEPGWH